jgi:hypothetical protein
MCERPKGPRRDAPRGSAVTNRASTGLAVVTRLARAWTRLYTSHLDPSWRDTRRAEIDSDLWESREDACGHSAPGVALQILGRLLRGMPHDVLWSIEHRGSPVRTLRRAAIVGAAAAALLAAFWVVSAWEIGPLPNPPRKMVFVAAPPPPAPPPGTVVGPDGRVVRLSRDRR